jgi:transketolase
MNVNYVPLRELDRLRVLEVDPVRRAAAFADACRINTLSMIMEAGSGHIGTSFSSMDILCWLHLEVLVEGDRYFSSKGHDAPALYSVLTALGRLDFDLVHRLRRLGGLPGHPDVLTTPQVHTNTGSLGMGISKARGFVLADRLQGRSGRIFVLTGDGELQEGQFWESLQPTVNRGMHEITVIVDHNKLQSDTWVSEVSDLGGLEAKVAAFGWAVDRCDGHDLAAVSAALGRLDAQSDGRPKLLIADTVKGKGVSFMEPHELPVAGDSLYAFHSGAPSEGYYENALTELATRLNASLDLLDVSPIEFTPAEVTRPAAPSRPQKLIAAYADALASEAVAEPRLVALSGDLSLDTGLVKFRAAKPERFFECGIAEMDMVSQAGAMALSGLLPVVHSFASFLTPRACEQVYNNASEHTKVIYAGSLVGIAPGGPGHSHQMIRDIALMASVPGMTCLEPFCEAETAAVVRWAVEEAAGPVYIRLVSLPWDLGFDPPAVSIAPGRGTVLRAGADMLVVTTGPVMVSRAWAVAERLAADGHAVGIVALPWLKDIDGAWLADVAGDAPIATIDNHYTVGGQGDAVLAALGSVDARNTVIKYAIDRFPVCGTNDEVLRDHGLDVDSLADGLRDRIAVVAP